MDINLSKDENQLAKLVMKAGNELSFPSYFVGGFVRDKLLGRPQKKDIDIVCVGSGSQLANKVASYLNEQPKVTVYNNFGTAMFKWRGWDVEFVGARRESYQRHSRKPIVEDGTLEDDQNRRDFTINALAISLNDDGTYGSIIDPFNGFDDLRNGLIRTPCDPLITFSDDPLRMMRAIRFSTQLHFTIDDNTYQAIENNAQRIEIVSQERVTDELNKIVEAQKPSIGFKHLFQTGLLHSIFPEMVDLQGVEKREGLAHKDNFYHTLQVLDNVAAKSDDLWLRWAAILHDIAKPPTKRFEKGKGWTFHGHDAIGAKMVPKIFRQLKLPMDNKMKLVQKLVALHLRPISIARAEVTDSAIRRLLYEAGDDLEALMTLCEADITSANENKVKKFLQNFQKVRDKLEEVEQKDKIRNWQPPISGEEIMKTFNIAPSKNVGIIKNAIKEAILDGDISNNYEEAYQFMLRKGEELGLQSSASQSS